MESTTHIRSASYKRHFRETLLLSIPVIIGQLGHVMMGVIDNMMVGKLGHPEYISAASLANGVFFLITVIGFGISMILSPLVAEAEGAGNPRKAATYLHQGIWLSIAISIILGGLVYASAWLLPWMNQPVRDVELAFSYLHILAWTTPLLLLFFAGKNFADGLSVTKVAMYITLLGLAFNVFANWLLIYGNWGFPRLELDGAGYATLTTRLIMALLIFGYIFKAKRFKAYMIPWQGIDKAISTKIIRLGIPSGLQFFFEVGAFVGAAIMIGWIGSSERAAHQIVISLASVSFMVVIGVAAGSAIRVGDALGRNDWVNLRKAGLTGIALGVSFMALSAMALIILKRILPALFLDMDPASYASGTNEYVLEVAASLMVMAAFFQIFDGMQAVGAAILRGIQDVRIPTFITFFSYWIIGLPVGYLLGFTFNLGLKGVWYGLVLSLIVASILLTYRFLKMTKPKGNEIPLQEPQMEKAM